MFHNVVYKMVAILPPRQRINQELPNVIRNSEECGLQWYDFRGTAPIKPNVNFESFEWERARGIMALEIE